MGAATGLAPLQRTVHTRTPAFAITTDGESGAFKTPFTGTIAGVTYVPDVTITGANTNFRTVQLINRGQNGLGNTVIATLDFTTGVNATGYQEKAIPLSGTAANLNVLANDILSVKSIHAGTGLADPGGLAVVLFNRD